MDGCSKSIKNNVEEKSRDCFLKGRKEGRRVEIRMDGWMERRKMNDGWMKKNSEGMKRKKRKMDRRQTEKTNRKKCKDGWMDGWRF